LNFALNSLHLLHVKFSLQTTMPFSEDYADVLAPFVDNYKNANNAKSKKVVLKNAEEALKESRNLREDAEDDLPKDLQTVCFIAYCCFLLS